jgi:hypothetical protein
LRPVLSQRYDRFRLEKWINSRTYDDLDLVDLADGAVSKLTPHDGPGRFAGGKFSPDGETIYLLFPDEGHGFSKAPNRVRAAVAIVRWFDRYLCR